jgi:hypothetical protein
MTRWILAGLIVLNVLLGAGVYLRFGGENAAYAQIGRGGGEFATVSGNNNGQAIVYILEANTGRLIAIRADPVNRKVELIGGKDVASDLARMP